MIAVLQFQVQGQTPLLSLHARNGWLDVECGMCANKSSKRKQDVRFRKMQKYTLTIAIRDIGTAENELYKIL